MAFEINGRKCDTSACSLKWDNWLGFNSTDQKSKGEAQVTGFRTGSGPITATSQNYKVRERIPGAAPR